ncbi:hypothetical protein BJX99DRAFT_225116 [Aspergillus californicus]
MTVTMEFTRGQKHPYSWHSVRRKVELVTKQRMKFLDEQRDKGATEADDLSNPRWRAVVDTWIPTWQRWEEAEAARIEKRDSRRPRKRKWTVTTPTSTTITDGVWDLPSSAPVTGNGTSLGAADGWRAPSSASSSPMVTSTQTHPQNPPAPTATPLSVSSTPVRLPPGFDTMFASTQAQSRSQPQTQTPSTPFTENQNQNQSQNQNHNHNHNHNQSQSQPQNHNLQAHRQNHHLQPPNLPPTPATDNTMMAAVLETLGKLNKHLDSTSSNPLSTDPSSQTLSQSQSNTQDSTNTSSTASGLALSAGLGLNGDDLQSQFQAQLSSASLNTMKEQLKREMMEELRGEWDKERAVLEEKLDSVQRTQEMILDMLRQEPA